jgi:hypothetical protein
MDWFVGESWFLVVPALRPLKGTEEEKEMVILPPSRRRKRLG